MRITDRALIAKAAGVLRHYAHVAIDSNVRPGLPDSQQDQYWREGKEHLALANKLSRLARRK